MKFVKPSTLDPHLTLMSSFAVLALTSERGSRSTTFIFIDMIPIFQKFCGLRLGLRCGYRGSSLSLPVSVIIFFNILYVCGRSQQATAMSTNKMWTWARTTEKNTVQWRSNSTAEGIFSSRYCSMGMMRVDRDSILVCCGCVLQSSSLTQVMFLSVSCEDLFMACLGSANSVCSGWIWRHESLHPLTKIITVWPRCLRAHSSS